jgi:hypothetical protein
VRPRCVGTDKGGRVGQFPERNKDRQCGPAATGKGGWVGILLERNRNSQRAPAVTDAPTKGNPVPPDHGLKKTCPLPLHIGGRRAFLRAAAGSANAPWRLVCHSSEYPQPPAAPCSSAPWPSAQHLRGKSLPPAHPAAWLFLQGRAGGAISRVQQWRPTCAGSEPILKGSGMLAAKRLFAPTLPLGKTHLAGRRSRPGATLAISSALGRLRATLGKSPPACPTWCQRTSATHELLEGEIFPAHPPCGLAVPD